MSRWTSLMLFSSRRACEIISSCIFISTICLNALKLVSVSVNSLTFDGQWNVVQIYQRKTYFQSRKKCLKFPRWLHHHKSVITNRQSFFNSFYFFYYFYIVFSSFMLSGNWILINMCIFSPLCLNRGHKLTANSETAYVLKYISLLWKMRKLRKLSSQRLAKMMGILCIICWSVL